MEMMCSDLGKSNCSGKSGELPPKSVGSTEEEFIQN